MPTEPIDRHDEPVANDLLVGAAAISENSGSAKRRFIT